MTVTREEVFRQASAEVWAIDQDRLHALLMSESPATPIETSHEPQIVGLTRPGPKSGRVARIPIVGPISRRASFWSMFFGGSSVDGLTKALREVAIDDTVGTVLLDIDSPGGTVSGMPELAAEVRRLRESKHVVAIANSLTASAAYWIASQADEVVATPESLTGSIGVFTVHEDWSKMLARVGIDVTYVHAGRYKVEGNPDQPLTDDARDHKQSIVDDAYRLFVNDVARGRGVSAAQVRSDYGEGRVLTATDALQAGMVDRIAGFDATVRRLAGVKAGDERDEPLAEQPNDSSNSLALMRRRLEIAQLYFQEEAK